MNSGYLLEVMASISRMFTECWCVSWTPRPIICSTSSQVLNVVDSGQFSGSNIFGKDQNKVELGVASTILWHAFKMNLME